MASTVEIKFGADTSDLKAGIARAASSINGFGSQVYHAFHNANTAANSVTHKIGSLASGALHEFARLGSGAGVAVDAIGGIAAASAASAVAASVVAAALGAVAASAVNFGMAVGHSAAQLGDTTENISRLVPVADAAGMSLNSLTTKLTTIGAKLDANDKTFKNALKALKINPETFNSAGVLDQMDMLQAHVSNLGESYNKTAALQVLFGTSAKKMETVLGQSTANFKNLEQAAQRTGTIMTGAIIDGMRGTSAIVDEVRNHLNEGKLAMRGLAITAYSVLKPAIDSILNDFAASTLGIDNFIESLDKGGANSAVFVAALQKVKDALAGFIIAYRTAGAAAIAYGEQLAMPFLKLGAAIVEGLTSGWAAISTFFSNLYNAAEQAAHGIAQAFADVGQVIATGITGHLSEAHAAFGKLETEAASAAAGMRAALAHPIPAVDDMVGKVTQKVGADWNSFQTTLLATAAKTRADLEKEWSKPISLPSINGQTAGAMPTDNSEAVRNEQMKIAGQIAVLKAGLERKKAIYAQEVAVGRMSNDKMVEAVKVAMDEEYQAELRLLRKEAAIGGMKVANKQAILNKIAMLQVTHDTQMITESTRTAGKFYQAYKSAFEQVGSSVSSSIMGMIQGQETLRKAAQKVLLAIIQEFVQARIRMVADWAAGIAAQTTATTAGEAVKTAAVTTGVAARTAAEQAGAAGSLAASAAGLIRQILADAKSTFAGVFAFLSPVMGPAAAGPAAAASGAVASLASFAIGSWQLPSDMIGQLHRGEMIVPAASTPWAQSLMANAASGGSSGNGGVTVNHTTHFNISALDSGDVKRWFKNNGKTILRTINDSVRLGAHLGLSKLPT